MQLPTVSGVSDLAHKISQTVVRMTQLHRQLGQVIRKVARSDEHFVVEKGGLPVAVLLSMNEYERLVRYQKLKDFERHARAIGEEVQRQGLTEEEVEAKVEEVRERLYQEGNGQQHQ